MNDLLSDLRVCDSTEEALQERNAIDEESKEMRARRDKQAALIADAQQKLRKLNAICDANPDEPDKVRKPKRDAVELAITIEAESQVLSEIENSIRKIGHRSRLLRDEINQSISMQIQYYANAKLDAARQRIREETKKFCLLHYIALGPGSSGGAEYELEMIAIDARYLYDGADAIISDAHGRLLNDAMEAV